MPTYQQANERKTNETKRKVLGCSFQKILTWILCINKYVCALHSCSRLH